MTRRARFQKRGFIDPLCFWKTKRFPRRGATHHSFAPTEGRHIANAEGGHIAREAYIALRSNISRSQSERSPVQIIGLNFTRNLCIILAGVVCVTDDEKIDFVAARILREYRRAFEALAN